MKIGIIGQGAIGGYVTARLRERGLGPAVILARAGARAGSGESSRTDPAADPIPRVHAVADLPPDLGLVAECAGHAALAEHGAAILARGIDIVSVSPGALADPALERALAQAARRGGARLHLAIGAIGALDSLQAARVGGLEEVIYVGRKPPCGWRGSPAEERLDLDALGAPAVHFEGSAREAALAYPRNANVAAAVALAGLGLDATRVRLVADPGAATNIHEVRARGAFGRLSFRVEGEALADNPRSSALAAMSVVAAIERHLAPVGF
ncbi:MAG: hypothetical protein Kow0058_01250 [Roseovarius sp.]